MNDSFAELGLRDSTLATLAGLGYEAPTPIQSRTIPLLLAGRDVLAQAQTGTGKTAAFALPIVERLDASSRTTQALILTPTRELAMQVADAIHTYAKGIEVHVLPVYGGAPIVLQMKHLQRGVHVVVGTPGRLIDHLDRKTLDLSNVRMVVLDEADEMLKMGFIEEVERILSSVPKPRQVALFSATMADEVARVAQRHMVNAERVTIEHHVIHAPAIEQRFLNLAEGQKLEALTQMLELEPNEAVLIFRRTKTGAAELAERLEGRGFSAVAMHGDMNQAMRENVIRRLRAGQIEIVVATDVAARGLDVEKISHVVNYDVPHDVEVYVHRIGRTGRAGRAGVATLFITPRERRMMREIERFTGTAIKPMKMPSRADVAARRIEVFKSALRKQIEEGDLDLYVEVVTQLAAEGPFDIADVAAAAAKIANGEKSLVVPKMEQAEAERPSFAPRAHQERVPSPRASGERVAEGRVRDEAVVTLQLSVGKREGIRPADIVGSIANEANVPGRDIGPIEIRDETTFVGIPAHFVDQVIEKVSRAKFRGRPVNIRVANAADARPQRKPYEKKAFDRKPYEKKSFEKKPYEKRSFDNKPFEKSPFEKKPYEKKHFEKKPFDKKTYAKKRPPR
jgi:ATP-dependent RNA helicase DeaD